MPQIYFQSYTNSIFGVIPSLANKKHTPYWTIMPFLMADSVNAELTKETARVKSQA